MTAGAGSLEAGFRRSGRRSEQGPAGGLARSRDRQGGLGRGGGRGGGFRRGGGGRERSGRGPGRPRLRGARHLLNPWAAARHAAMRAGGGAERGREGGRRYRKGHEQDGDGPHLGGTHGDRHREPGDRRDDQDVRSAVGRGARRQARPGGRGLPDLPADDVRRAGRVDAGGGRHPRPGGRRHRRDDDDRDGQDAEVGQGRGPEVRQGLPLLRRARRGVPGRRAGRPGRRQRHPGLHPLPAHRARPGRHALELPAVAGDALRRPGAHGRQRRAAQARLQRPADGAVPGGPVQPGRLPRRGRSRRCSSDPTWSSGSCATPG